MRGSGTRGRGDILCQWVPQLFAESRGVLSLWTPGSHSHSEECATEVTDPSVPVPYSLSDPLPSQSLQSGCSLLQGPAGGTERTGETVSLLAVSVFRNMASHSPWEQQLQGKSCSASASLGQSTTTFGSIFREFSCQILTTLY